MIEANNTSQNQMEERFPINSITNNSSADRHSLVDEADPLTDLDVVRLAHVAHDLLEVRADKVAVDALDGADAVGPAHVPPVLLALARHVGAQGAPHARLRGDRVDLGNNRITIGTVYSILIASATFNRFRNGHNRLLN